MTLQTKKLFQLKAFALTTPSSKKDVRLQCVVKAAAMLG